MQSSEGSIVKLKNVIFKTKDNEKKCSIDHAYYHGRPALVICETEETLYYLLITHQCWWHPEDFKDYPLPDSLSTKGFVKFNEIHSRPLCHQQTYCRVSDKYLLKILLLLCRYQELHKVDDEYLKIKPLIDARIEQLTLNEEKSLEKIKK